MKCISCGRIDHNVLECEKIHYTPNKELVLLKVIMIILLIDFNFIIIFIT